MLLKEISKIVMSGINCCTNSQDDIIIWEETKEIHDQCLKEVLALVKESGLKLNKDKCIFGAKELPFLGHVISQAGVKPDSRKVEVITELPVPTSEVELQRFWGLVNSLGKFIPNLSDETALLHQLLRKDAGFLTQKPQFDTFNRLKWLISTVAVLQFYDPNFPTRLRTDFSSFGLGAMIEQYVEDNWHPIIFVSRSLDKSEQNYVQIERETLPVVFPCELFHEYIYSKEFLVQNDHKSLKNIFFQERCEMSTSYSTFFS